MQLIKTALTLIATALITTAAQAQYKLPASHNNQHDELLASQKPLSADVKVANVLKYISELNKVDLPDEDEVYGDYWESSSVNPYAGAEIPAIAHLDVSTYSHPITGRVTSRYGYRPRFRRVHKGIDLSLHVGDTVRAAFDGKVRLTKFERKGYGYYVVVRHDNGMETVYGHLSRFLVKPDQRVKAGEPIALGGNTGRSTGPHLHFETRYMGLAINPEFIIDFDNQVAIKDVYTFDKAEYEKVTRKENSRVKKKSKARRAKAKSTKKRKSKTTAKK